MTSLFFGAVGAMLAELMRVQLSVPSNTVLSAALYNEFVTMHGLVIELDGSDGTVTREAELKVSSSTVVSMLMVISARMIVRILFLLSEELFGPISVFTFGFVNTLYVRTEITTMPTIVPRTR
ncbi:MAG: hypothetical protein JRM79_04605 [Nitrososphaerota archaeon]|nr:hypothetical protein [Nitrososphaerota archaeon]